MFHPEGLNVLFELFRPSVDCQNVSQRITFKIRCEPTNEKCLVDI